ncbi:hypothetical protein [Odoribacter splanchnicus]|uniref:hypothetical protein n=1 Tax=Odoribacter splanchnicus TaxID=28118 RepID=UPI002330ECD3|nr:hypothetical protein [Odoribacter splanchnicus]MDB9209679.1 hypothetical protein [Odoribacter splanchnicus]MDB9225393.1 hypothetical protein [Odoribacter splanchnicus]MDB9241792.1 hypothetical protein [Odoribacter splanchnicus]
MKNRTLQLPGGVIGDLNLPECSDGWFRLRGGADLLYHEKPFLKITHVLRVAECCV